MNHGEGKVLIYDAEFASVVHEALKTGKMKDIASMVHSSSPLILIFLFGRHLLVSRKPILIRIDDPAYYEQNPKAERTPLPSGEYEYEQLLSSTNANPEFNWKLPTDEWDTIALNYTSGTTGTYIL